MKLSIVIVNYNVKYFLEQCLLSVFASISKIESEVFVVDNNSIDGSLAYLKPKFPSVNFIANNDNQGFSIANNQAIRQSTGQYILLLNPDTILGENTLIQVCEFMDKHPEAGGLGVKMIDGYGAFLPESKRGFPSPWNSFCKMFGLSKLFPHSKLLAKYHLLYLDENKIHKVDVLSGAFMLVRKETLDQVGLLDETFFMYGEDIDLSYRITTGNYVNYYFPSKIIHYKGESTKKDIRYVRIFYEAILIFFKKHYPHYSKLYSLFIHFAIYLRACMSAVKKIIFPNWKKRKKKRKKRKLLIVGNENISNEALEIYLSNKKECEDIFFINPNKEEVSTNLWDHSSFKNVIFCINNLKYEEIISLMDSCKNKNIHYYIYYPEIKTIIAANEILN